MENDFIADHPVEALVAAEVRIDELEVKLSFTEDNVEVLSQRIYQQQLVIDHLIRELDALRQQMLAAAPGDSSSPRDDIPPHY